jgi:hypothetical protein
MAKEPCHNAKADGDEIFPRRDSEGLAMEPPHSETGDGDGVILTAIQLASSGWRGSHATARQRKEGEGIWCSAATDSCACKRQGT